MDIALFKDKRFFLVALVLLSVAISFWATSRVPALNEKAILGGDIELNSLGFEVVLPISEDDPLVKQALYSTVNWLETNRKGMTFGVLFAAILMTLLSLFRKTSFESGFANSLLGMTIGAPLGVCVNCAAPIATGLYSGGARIETSLAAMISSPTLNIIVLTILFSLFPLYMVIIKLGVTVAFILLVIPVVSRLLANDVLVCDTSQTCDLPVGMGAAGDAPPAGWGTSMYWVVCALAKNLWYIVRTTVPLMFLAGFLGVAVITVIPFDTLAEMLPTGNALMVLAVMGVVGIVGLFLPVPIAFDVLVCAILLAAGMPVKYVMVLLFTLGIFSVYSFSIVWKMMAKRLAVGITGILLVLGVGAGLTAHEFDEWDTERQRELFFKAFSENTSAPKGLTVERIGHVSDDRRFGTGDQELVAKLRGAALAPKRFPAEAGDGITVSKIDFHPRPVRPSTAFTRLQGSQLGFDEPFSYSVLNLLTISRFRGLASGDIHNDGYADILVTSDQGLSLFANRQGERFERQPIPIPTLKNHRVGNAALVDLNNDGWLDIYFATYREGNYVIHNQHGRFLEENLYSLPSWEDTVLSAAAAFGDVDKDGDLDIVLGNWSLGFLAAQGLSAVTSSRNALLLNESDAFSILPLAGWPGETLSTLISDFDNDGMPDLIVGNDADVPDLYYRGDGKGGFTIINRSAGVIPHTPKSTMSITTADIDNDLIQEIYLGQISGMSGTGEIDIRRVDSTICEELVDRTLREECEHLMSIQARILQGIATQNVFECLEVEEKFRQDCIAINLVYRAMRWEKDESKCDLLPAVWEELSFVCKGRFGPRYEPTEADRKEGLPQFKNDFNILLASAGDGSFTDRAGEMDIRLGGWTWNAKFADVDNDEWQDLYIVNGGYFTRQRESNRFFHNQQGKKFVERTADYDLGSFLATSSYTYIDIENDGDLDIITLPIVGPVVVYENNLAAGQSIVFEVRDKVGNHFGIGSEITIYYDQDESRHQMREIKSSGGFVSYDAPMAHFGLGDYDGVERVVVKWSTGERTEINGDFPAGAKYIITRDTDRSSRKPQRADAEYALGSNER